MPPGIPLLRAPCPATLLAAACLLLAAAGAGLSEAGAGGEGSAEVGLRSERRRDRPSNSSRRLQGDEDEIICPLSGVVYNLALVDLPHGWVPHYDQPYSHATSPNDMRPMVGDCIMWGASKGDRSEVLSIAAFGDRNKIITEAPLWENSVYWYTSLGLSGGFSREGDVSISMENPGDQGLYDCSGRMSWLLNGFGGYSAGCTKDLDDSVIWRKVVWYGPRGVFCDDSVCTVRGEILKSAEGLPAYCKGGVCTREECCQAAPTCTIDICAAENILKDGDLPSFCATQFCQEAECCEPRPRCRASDCGEGFHLKPTDTVPPIGQPRDGCKSHKCTREECCDASPRCPAEVCTKELTLTTLDPTPWCSSFDCLTEDCCSLAGVCEESICGPGYMLKPYYLPPWCERPECTQRECCDYIPPQVNVSHVWFADLDPHHYLVAGEISWIPPPPTIPNVTHYTLFIGDNYIMRHPLGEVPWGTNSLDIPVGIIAGKYLFIYTSNIGGDVDVPIWYPVSDAAHVPDRVYFDDLDLDATEVGGFVTWPQLIPSASNVSTWEAKTCQLGRSLRIEGGFLGRGSGASTSFFVGGELVPNASATWGSVAIVVVSNWTKQVETVAIFETSMNRMAGQDFDQFLDEKVTDGSIVMLSTWGAASRYINRTNIAMTFGAEEIFRLQAHDSYALIGIKGLDFTLRERRVDKDLQLQAVVDLLCPVAHYEVHMHDGSGQEMRYLGNVPSSGSSFIIPADTPVFGISNITVFAVSYVQEATTDVEPCPVNDDYVLMDEVAFVEEDPADTSEIGGIVQWRAISNSENVEAYRVYIAISELGENRSLVGEVSAGVNQLDIEPGTTRGNTTYMLIYAVSSFVEQSTPRALDLSNLLGAVEVTVVVVIVGSIGALQMAKIMEALEKSAKRMDKKKIENIPMAGKFFNEQGDFVKVSGGGPLGMIPWRGPVSQLCQSVSHHDPKIKLKFKGEKRKGKQSVKMVSSCINVWDNDDIMLKKVSNNDIIVYGKAGDVTKFRRKPVCWWRIIEGSTVCSRTAIRMYAPMIALLGVTFLIAYSGELFLAAMLVAIALTSIAILAVASRMECTKDAINIVYELPPKSGRAHFWGTAQVLVGCLPAAPAFLAGTTVGYAAGCLALLGTFLSSRQAYGLASLVEGMGGMLISLYSIYLKTIADDEPGTAAAAKTTAAIMGGAMVAVKAVDTQIENMERLHNKTQISEDELMRDAESVSDATGLTIANAIALEAFAAGCVESRMQSRMAIAMKKAAHGLVTRCSKTLSTFMTEVYDGTESKWPMSSSQLGLAVGKAIDAASADFHAAEISSSTGWELREAQDSAKEALGELEMALKQLLRGPLASKPVNRCKACLKQLRHCVAELSTELMKSQEMLGASDAAGQRAFARLLGMYSSKMTSTATYVRDEISSGDLSAVDLRILFVKVEQLQGQAERASKVLETLTSPPADVHDARLATNQMQEALKAAIDTLQSLASPSPPPSELKAVLEGLDEVIGVAEVYLDLQDTVFATTPEPGQEEIQASQRSSTAWRLSRLFADPAEASKAKAEPVDQTSRRVALRQSDQQEEAPAAPPQRSPRKSVSSDPSLFEEVDDPLTKAAKDIKQRTLGRGNKRALHESAEALCLARSAVGLVSAVHGEIEAAAAQVERLVAAMQESRRQGYRVLHSVSQAHEAAYGLSVHQLRKLQKQTIEFTIGHPVQALVVMQEAMMDVSRLTLNELVEDLNKFSSLLDVGGDEENAMTRTSLMGRVSVKVRAIVNVCTWSCSCCGWPSTRSRVHPQKEKQSEAEKGDTEPEDGAKDFPDVEFLRGISNVAQPYDSERLSRITERWNSEYSRGESLAAIPGDGFGDPAPAPPSMPQVIIAPPPDEPAEQPPPPPPPMGAPKPPKRRRPDPSDAPELS